MAGIREIANTAGVKVEDAKAVFQAVTALVEEGNVTIQGFGVFRIRTRAAKTGRNPQTGESVHIPERQVLTFKPSKVK